MPSLLTAVKSKMFIAAHRKARGMLDGEYASVFRGHSLDFDDLRAYVPGDAVRDIDWKASARVGAPLIKRYVATRRQQVLFVADTGRNMAALAKGGESKKDIAVMVIGVIGTLALNHGDSVSLIHGDERGTQAMPAQGTESHLETLLRRVDSTAVLTAGQSSLSAQLEYAASHVKRHTLMVVLADDEQINARSAKVLRRLAAQHEILWIHIEDAELAGVDALAGVSYDVADFSPVLSALAGDPELARDYAYAVAERSNRRSEVLRSNRIAMAGIGHTEQVMGRIFALLERHRRAR
ncbi:DUF58 domain-containing protein [Arthrobacter cryoconiti]|uniref:DUF58 domain-containing protein n=1 Tax=Arthrobacter cryoconiti TaxID=748907 RepID=A0ABV8R0V2_9MICC|nr:DUF58 domain-containing protein [Arthrobacter cryoconiti]MCC9068514.1 DUF58 domain-containing protein [Arthrobacter cryoconiti]